MSRKIKLPAAWGYKMARTKKDFKIQFTKGSGPGGQNRNKVETGVRLTDLVTGLSVCATDSKSQDDNMKSAKERLFDKLVEHYRKEYTDSLIVDKSPQASIRTYKENQDRVIDHRTGNQYSYKEVLSGKQLDKVIEDLLQERVTE